MRLCQVIALANGKKSRAKSAVTKVYQALQKGDLLGGLARSYTAKDEDGDQLPPERKLPQVSVEDALCTVQATLTDLFDTVATQDVANTKAVADVVVDGETILTQVPVTHLLFLEKELTDLHTLVDKLPTLDPAEQWEFSENSNCYETDEYETIKTAKVRKVQVLYDATPEHPAQTEVYTEDVPVGKWTCRKFSGAIPARKRREMLERVRKLQDAVKIAREEANSSEVTEYKQSEKLFQYVLGN